MSNSKLSDLITRIDEILPQTQCEQCGFKGCLPYAAALAENKTQINRCPPGGIVVIKALAHILNKPLIDLDTNCGVHKPPQVVIIDESLCIGCTKCIQACPVDAIIGAKKRMHTIITAECTGCELCIPVCPLDCILVEPLKIPISTHNNDIDDLNGFSKNRALKSRFRFNKKQDRYSQQLRLTETVLPQNIALAERVTPKAMLDLISLARNKAQYKEIQEAESIKK